jgi:uncharacterized DUF497 family protein
MEDEWFEWSDTKARANLKKHGVSFEAARLVFDDPASIDEIDDREDYGEDRFVIHGNGRWAVADCNLHRARWPLPHHLSQEGDTA